MISPGVTIPGSSGKVTVRAASASFTSGGDGTTTQAASLQESQVIYQDFERFSYDLSDNLSFYVQGIAAEGFTSGYHVQNYIQTGTSANLVFSNNPFLSPATQALLANSKTGAAQMFTDTQYFQYPDYAGESSGALGVGLAQNIHKMMERCARVDLVVGAHLSCCLRLADGMK